MGFRSENDTLNNDINDLSAENSFHGRGGKTNQSSLSKIVISSSSHVQSQHFLRTRVLMGLMKIFYPTNEM